MLVNRYLMNRSTMKAEKLRSKSEFLSNQVSASIRNFGLVMTPTSTLEHLRITALMLETIFKFETRFLKGHEVYCSARWRV